MKKSILFVLIFCSTWVNAQTLLERIVDSVSIKERHEFILSKLDSAFIFDNDKLEFVRPFEPENCVVYDTYNCHKGPGGNYFYYEESLVDTNLFTKNYFVSGKFLADWVKLVEQGKAGIRVNDSFVFDTVNDKAYSCVKRYPRLSKIHHVSHDLDTILHISHDLDTFFCKFGYPIRELDHNYEEILGKLFKADVIDFVFCFPTFFGKADWDFSKDYVFWSPGCYFAMKGDKFFYIDTQEKKIYPMEEVVENHWDWITNVIEKQE